MFNRKPRANVYRDKRGRFCGDPDVPKEPAVFSSIMASPEFEAELEDLENYRKEESDTYEILCIRKAAWRRKRMSLTCFTCTEVTWMDALNEIGDELRLPGFPFKSDAEMYADGRWLQDYEDGLTTSQSLVRYRLGPRGPSLLVHRPS